MLVIIVGIFAIIGALLRDGVGILTLQFWNGIFPVATLIVNLVGCFILGWSTSYIKELDNVHTYIKTGVGTGLIGSFTTFSTFSVETIRLFESGQIHIAALYLVISYIGGLWMTFLGFRTGELILVNHGGEFR